MTTRDLIINTPSVHPRLRQKCKSLLEEWVARASQASTETHRGPWMWHLEKRPLLNPTKVQKVLCSEQTAWMDQLQRLPWNALNISLLSGCPQSISQHLGISTIYSFEFPALLAEYYFAIPCHFSLVMRVRWESMIINGENAHNVQACHVQAETRLLAVSQPWTKSSASPIHARSIGWHPTQSLACISYESSETS